tara:strand:- start:185 stop:1333 length:1149 start_codon:yes stop_codon:yes gene_type:complete
MKIYLDNAASTKIDSQVIKAMLPYFDQKYGNARSIHQFGQEAKIALEESRETIAEFINADSNEIVFTSSATEGNNLALKGIAFANRDKGKHIIISSIEHPCIMESAAWLEKQGFKVTKLKVDKDGLVDPSDLEKAIQKDTILVSIIFASNEIGTIQPIEKLAKICRDKGVYFHTDAVQAFGKLDIDVKKMNIDLLTTSSHKVYGPKGVACLYVKQGIDITPLLHGGGQEMGLRGSTVNVSGVVGFGKAVELCRDEMKEEEARLAKLRDKLIKNILRIPKTYLNGHSKKRLSNNVNFRFSFIEGESLVIQLDLKGVAVSTGSACSSITLEPSHILLATGLKPEEAHGSLRITLGRFTTEQDIDYVIKVLPKIVKDLRDISPFK